MARNTWGTFTYVHVGTMPTLKNENIITTLSMISHIKRALYLWPERPSSTSRTYVPSAVTTPAEVLATGRAAEASAGSPVIAAPAAATAPASTEISWKTPCRVVAGLVGWSVILGKVPLCKLRVDAAVGRAKRDGVVAVKHAALW